MCRTPRTVHDPTAHRVTSLAVWRGVPGADLASREVVGETHDDAILDEAREQLPAHVPGRKPEHLAEAGAAMLFDELDEKALEIRTERDRHASTSGRPESLPLPFCLREA